MCSMLFSMQRTKDNQCESSELALTLGKIRISLRIVSNIEDRVTKGSALHRVVSLGLCNMD